MTFNLRYASAPDGDNRWVNASQTPERRAVAVMAVTNHSPDLIGFQEGEASQLDDLESELPDDYAFQRQAPSGGSGNERAAFAYNTNRLQLLDRGVISLGNSPGGGYWNNVPDTPFDPYDLFAEVDLKFPRLALWGRFAWRATGQELHFYTTHFDTYTVASNGESQAKSAFLIIDDSKARTARIPSSPLAIAVGDFNSSQNDRAWKLFTGLLSTNGVTGDFTDSWQQVHGNFNHSGTFHGFNGGVISGNSRIDWILHRGGFTATQTWIAADSAVATGCGTCPRTQYPSDHYPVVADLVLPAPAPDYDLDRLPDAAEQASALSLPADPDSDGDLLVDGDEDLNGNGAVDGGESDPSQGTDTQLPTDIRAYQMDGILDYPAALLASHGLHLYWRFDGRYLYVATQDAGEGSDHFIFVATHPNVAVNAPWAKKGAVGAYAFFLADENGSDFSSWYNAAGAQVTNLLSARTATYYEDDGMLEGVIDLSQTFGSGFTQAFFLAAAPFATDNGGAMVASAQVPEGNGDTNLLGSSEYVMIPAGDIDGDGISDYADPDRDGDGLSDAWEVAHGLDPSVDTGDSGPQGDPDSDGFLNQAEFLACTFPLDSNSLLEASATLSPASLPLISWEAVHGKAYYLTGSSNPAAADWLTIAGPAGTNSFPTAILEVEVGGGPQNLQRVEVSP